MAEDPRRLFDAKDVEAAALYAQRVGGSDFYPLKLDADGYLLTNLTVGTITAQLSSTASTITNAAGNPVPVDIKGPVDASGYVLVNMTVGTISLSSTASVITNAVLNPVNVALTSTEVTVKSAVAGFNVNIATATLGTVTVSGTVTPSTTAATITNAVANPVNTSLVNTAVSVSNSAGVFNVNIRTATLGTVTVTGTVTPSTTGVTVSLGRTLTGCTVSISATTGTVTTAGTNRLKIYAISVTTTATTSSVISFINGTYGGLTLWKAVLQAPSGANAGLNLAVAPPAFLFATGSAQLLRLNQTSAIPIEVSVSYFDEA